MVELARGYDGPLRGKPEPVLLFGVYRITEDQVALVSRRIVQLRPSKSFPTRLDGDVDLGARLSHAPDLRILVVSVALEEDDGRGIQQLYADFESPAHLSGWAVDAHVPDPIPLLEWARTAPADPSSTTRIHLVDASGDLRDQALGDDWVGAALFHVDVTDTEPSERRMRFVSADGRNDWTAVVDADVR